MMKTKKTAEDCVKLQIPAQMANPSPPIGPILGQKKINIMEFCRQFNKQTQSSERGVPLSVVIAIRSDRSFSFVIKSPPSSFLLKKAAGVEHGSSKPHTQRVGEVTEGQIREIATIKLRDTNSSDIEAVSRSILGTAKSIGLKIKSCDDEKINQKEEDS